MTKDEKISRIQYLLQQPGVLQTLIAWNINRVINTIPEDNLITILTVIDPNYDPATDQDKP